jgi:hypothetical protein
VKRKHLIFALALILPALLFARPAAAGPIASMSYAGNSVDFSQGQLILGSGIATCGAATTGAIRYNSATPRIEYCNGTSWSTGSTSVAATVDLTSQGADIAWTTLITPATNNLYRISCYVIVTRAATTSSTLPGCNLSYTDETGTAHQVIGTSASTANTVGTNLQGMAVIYAKSGTAIQYNTAGFASSGATSMQYAVHVRLEQPLGQ